MALENRYKTFGEVVKSSGLDPDRGQIGLTNSRLSYTDSCCMRRHPYTSDCLYLKSLDGKKQD